MASKTTIYLCKDYPFSDASHVFWNGSQAGIKSFVDSYIKNGGMVISDLSNFDPMGGVARFPYTFTNLNHFNYMVINQYDRLYYCFINSVNWSSNLNTCTINYKIDVWNTFFSRATLKQSYIERELVANDTVGTHLVDEGLSPSDYITQSVQSFGGMSSATRYLAGILVSDTSMIFEHQTGAGTEEYQNIIRLPSFNTAPNIVRVGLYEYTPQILVGSIPLIMKAYSHWGKSDAILGAVMFPNLEVSDFEEASIYYYWENPDYVEGGEGTKAYKYIMRHDDIHVLDMNGVKSATALELTDLSISRPSSLNGYTPRNNKMLTHPFVCAELSSSGNSSILKFEKSSNHSSITVSYCYDTLSGGMSYGAVKGYDGITGINTAYMVSTTSYPVIPLSMDAYTNWLYANSESLINQANYIASDYSFNQAQLNDQKSYADAMSTASAIGSVIGAMAIDSVSADTLLGTSNVLTAAADRQFQYNQKSQSLEYNMNKSADTLKASLTDKSKIPDTIKGSSVPNGKLAFNCDYMYLTVKTCYYDQAKAFDNYFSRFGYKINEFKTPNLYIRKIFDYKKIPDIQMLLDAPTDVVEAIKTYFRNGVTIWHDKSTLFDYESINSNH